MASDTWLSTRQAAALLGVGTTSIKRWADEGLLRCEKTIGGHRRFLRASVLELKRATSTPAGESPSPESAEAWVRRLVYEDVKAATEAIERDHGRLGELWRVCDELGGALRELGRQWESGTLNVVQEHVASAHLIRALHRVGDRIALPRDAPLALLVTAAGDDHTLGLALAELCLRELGWATRWVGRRAPIDQTVVYIAEGAAALVAVSASVYSTDAQSLATQAARVGSACRARGARLVLGGEGLWPDPPPYGARVRSFRELHEIGERPGHVAASRGP
jgi:excisionase family DNA binding protein